MKTTFALLATIIIFCTTNAKADGGSKTISYDKNSCLHIKGIVDNDNDYRDCFVELISPNKTIDTVVLSQGNENFEFVLRKNCEYTIRISKKGYLSKTIAINTQILTLESEIHFFEFDTFLIKDAEVAKLNKTLINAPVALVSYNYQLESFAPDSHYTELMKKEMYHLTNNNQGLGGKENAAPLSTKCHSFLALSR